MNEIEKYLQELQKNKTKEFYLLRVGIEGI